MAYEISMEEIEEIAKYWSALLEEPDVNDNEETLALSYLALYSALKNLQESSIDPDLPKVNTVDMSTTFH